MRASKGKVVAAIAVPDPIIEPEKPIPHVGWTKVALQQRVVEMGLHYEEKDTKADLMALIEGASAEASEEE
jgi:hypothetical protein